MPPAEFVLSCGNKIKGVQFFADLLGKSEKLCTTVIPPGNCVIVATIRGCSNITSAHQGGGGYNIEIGVQRDVGSNESNGY